MKKLILQLAVKPEQQEVTDKKVTTFSYLEDMYETSERMARKYAHRCGADYYVITDANDWKPGIGKHVAYQKFKVYDFVEYDRILYIDSDYIIKENAPNAFEIFNEFSAVVDPGKTEKMALGINIPKERYFNSGFLFFTKEVLDRTKDIILTYDLSAKWKLRDQAVWNKAMYESNIDYVKLKSEEWNPVTTTFGLYGDHYSGIHKNKWGRVSY